MRLVVVVDLVAVKFIDLPDKILPVRRVFASVITVAYDRRQ